MPAELPPLSAYLHLPWCLAKCPYCDFNSHRVPDAPDTARAVYVDALVQDIAQQAPGIAGRTVETVFLGGGTPSLFTPEEIGRVLTALDEAVSLAADAEITMEVNPGALERGSFAGYRAAGVNRVSIGGQSFDAAQLKRLGRLHDPAAIGRAVDAARQAGFERINVDIMYALPEQSVDAAVADVRAAVALDLTHVSHYQLTLEPNTVFHAQPPTLPGDDDVADMMQATDAVFAAAGLARYEVSALAAPGEACRHNLNYWGFGDYLGIGAGAHGKLSDGELVTRTVRPNHPRGYLDALAAGAAVVSQPVSGSRLAFEYMLNALRLVGGFSLQDFEARTGLPRAAVTGRLAEASERGLMLEREDHIWQPTALGARFLNDLQALFLD
ncbi:MAG: radical SAM family heme chaperone HemW [Pseudomonadota bacterium]